MAMRLSQWKDADRRKGPRRHLQLRLAMIYPQYPSLPARPMFQGKTSDLGLSGLSIVVDYNVFQAGEVVIVLALPPAYAGAPRQLITATAVMTHALYSSKLGAYKIGLTFRKFRGNGKALLDLALRHALEEDAAAAMQSPSGRVRARLPRDSQRLGR
jgi:hypothetical protein